MRGPAAYPAIAMSGARIASANTNHEPSTRAKYAQMAAPRMTRPSSRRSVVTRFIRLLTRASLRALGWRRAGPYYARMASALPEPPADLGLAREEPLARHTYMRVGGPAAYFGV